MSFEKRREVRNYELPGAPGGSQERQSGVRYVIVAYDLREVL